MDNLTRMEQYWQGATNLANGEPMGNVPDPLTREEQYFKAFLDAFAGYINSEKQIFLDLTDFDLGEGEGGEVEITDALSVEDAKAIALAEIMPDMVVYISGYDGDEKYRLISTNELHGGAGTPTTYDLMFACPMFAPTGKKPIGVKSLHIYTTYHGSVANIKTYARYHCVEYAEASE